MSVLWVVTVVILAKLHPNQVVFHNLKVLMGGAPANHDMIVNVFISQAWYMQFSLSIEFHLSRCHYPVNVMIGAHLHKGVTPPRVASRHHACTGSLRWL